MTAVDTIERPKTDTPPVAVQTPSTALATVSDDNTQLGFATAGGFALIQRIGKMFSESALVPKDFQRNIPNCVIATNLANRIGADPLMVMQNLYIVHGRPGWSSQFLIATFNTCGRFSAMRFEFFGTEEDKDAWGCRAWAVEKETGEKLIGSTITIGLARKEGWLTKSGSKWQTMPQQMLMYRAAGFFVRAYAPELAMGLQTREENEDITLHATQDDNGSYSVQDGGAATIIQNLNDKLRGDNVIDGETGEVISGAQAEVIPPQAADKKPSMEEKLKKAETAVGAKKCATCVGSGVLHTEDGKGPCPDCRGG